ncbi:hypothetical protein WDW37_08785 [Bdellovibrionota bacterium FG-1]
MSYFFLRNVVITAVGPIIMIALVSCAPKIYLNDRHTIMEEEAAGEWPEFEKEALEKSKESGPVAFQKTEMNARKKRLYQVLNGESVTH